MTLRTLRTTSTLRATDGGSSSGPGRGRGGSGLGPGRRRASRGSRDGVAATARRRADALMGGADGEPGTRSVPEAPTGPDPDPLVAPGPLPATAPAAAPTPPPRSSTTSPPAPPPGNGSALPGPRARLGPALRERIPVWLQLRCGVEPKTLAALAVVLAVAVGFAAAHFWSARPHPVRPPDLVGEAARAGAARPAPGDAAVPGPSPGATPVAEEAAHVVVDVSGKVRRPGIQRLPSGARVADALRAAGGARSGVDLTGLNRARVLVDGEQIVVGAPPGSPVVDGGASPGGTGGGSGSATGPVSLNSATVDQLDTLPGVGPVLAQHIIDYRMRHGGFRSVDELREVNGIGDRRFAELRPLVGP
ncbi:ComEA family DNA-binding protein [Streptomyces sp. NPDC001455]|uniref:ComEA family DNA-binding protein n=1 Tax=Streptomyces sp. NPDC001455 TaxID=3154518 RepID=UPI00332D7509